HFRSSRPSVLPKPPLPRAVGGSVATSSHIADTTGAITSCAMAWPRFTVTGAVPRFTSSTCSWPRKPASIVPGAFRTVTRSRLAPAGAVALALVRDERALRGAEPLTPRPLGLGAGDLDDLACPLGAGADVDACVAGVEVRGEERINGVRLPAPLADLLEQAR